MFLWPVRVAGQSRVFLVTSVQRKPCRSLIAEQGDPPATELFNYRDGCPRRRKPCQVVILVEHDDSALHGITAKRLGGAKELIGGVSV